MNRIVSALVLLLISWIGHGQSSTPYTSISLNKDQNYKLERVYETRMTNSSGINYIGDVIETVSYFDGLGRSKQTIGINQSGGSTIKDMVTPFNYDKYGRRIKESLPYPSSGTPGTYRSFIAAHYFYGYTYPYSEDFQGSTSANAYTEKLFEESPLGRIKKIAGPGEDWKMGNGNEVEYEYDTNSFEEVRLYKVNFYYGLPEYPILALGNDNYYPAGALIKNITKDENHISGTRHTVEEFKDREGKLILKRSYGDSDINGDGEISGFGENNIKHDTYYVYDKYDNLTYVLPPKADSHFGKPSSSEINELCYQYKYDEKNRIIAKKIPGKGWEYIVYNSLDQPILTQDPILREKGKWAYTKYDAFGRVIITGLYISGNSQSTLQNSVDNYYINNSSYNVWEDKNSNSSTNYYTNQSFPTTNTEELTLNYFDNYNFNTAVYGLKLNENTLVFGENVSYNVKGLQTGSRVKVLGQSQEKWITTVFHYDDHGKNIYVGIDNQYLSSTHLEKYQLSFTGIVEKKETTHKKGTSSAIKIIDLYYYDHMNRLKKHTQQINNNPLQLIAENEYDALGRMVKKSVGNIASSSNRLQEINYEYNVRGWLKSINDVGNLGTDLFSFKISYNNPDLSGSVGLYNGNISETIWRTANDKNASTPVSSRAYQFEYDGLNRLVDADYFVNSSTPYITEFDMSSAYDKNGNITKLSRGRSYGTIDALSYSYNNNQLIEVVDNGYSSSKGKGFVDDGVAGNDYTYDTNGNLKTDLNKGISSISYNHLNLPNSIAFSGQQASISYVYDATGRKLKKQVSGSRLSTKTTLYADGFIYENDVLNFFSTPEGYVSYDNGQFNYVYNYVDHLGNVRLSYTDGDGNGSIDPATEIIQEKNYYPFGLEHKGYNSTIIGTENNYKTYQGQELEEELGKNTLAFQWRDYDPAISRFNKIDRFAEKYYDQSPYNFTRNNPIRFAEIAGDSVWINYKNENILYEDGNLYNRDGTAYDGKGLKVKKDGTTKLKGFLGKAVTALDAIRTGGDAGGELVGDLQSSDQHVFLGKGSNGATGLRVSWNPSNRSGGPDQTGSTNRPSFIGLAHELGHAHDALDGVVDRTTWITTSGGKAIPNAEIYGSHWENRIRGENGLSLRTHYGIDQGANIGKLLGPGGGSVHFSKGYSMPSIQLQSQGTFGNSNLQVVKVPGSNTTIFQPFKY